MLFRVLGPVRLLRDGTEIRLPGGRERTVLCVLLLAAGRPVAVDRIMELLWADRLPADGHAAIHTYVSRLRAALSGLAPVLVRRGDCYLLDVDPEDVDIHQFSHIVGRSRQTADLVERARMLREALVLWRGPVAADVRPSELRERIVGRLDEQRLTALRMRIDADLSLGDHHAVTAELVDLVNEYPYDEDLTGQLMLALYRSGRRSDALDAYRCTRDRFAAELGLDPGEQLRQLQAAILRVDPQLDLRCANARAVAADLPTQRVSTGDATGHAESTPLRPAQLPADPTAFVGRRRELDRLTALVESRTDDHPSAVVISGTAGVGKTALAVWWANRVAARFPDGQLYLNLRGFDPAAAMTAAEAIRTVLDAFEVPVQRIPVGLDALVGLYRSLLAGRRMLLVLDNVSDADQVRPLLPGSPHCLTVVTSRHTLAGLVALDGAYALDLDCFTAAEARQMLNRRLGATRLAKDPAAVAEIIERCARLPLALALVAGRAATHPGLPMLNLADQLRDHVGLDALASDDLNADIRSVFSWSYQALSAEAAQLFRLLGLHPGPHVGLAAAASLAGNNADATRTLLDELTRVHLSAEQSPQRFGSHDLLRAYANELAVTIEPEAARATALHRLLDHYVRSACAAALHLSPYRAQPSLGPMPEGVTLDNPGDPAEALAWFANEHATLLACVRLCATAGLDEYTGPLAWAMSDFLQRRGHWQDQAFVHTTALDSARRLGDLTEQARAHRHLGRAHTLLGNLDEANAQFRLALALCAQTGDHVGQAHTYMNLANAAETHGDITGALEHAIHAQEQFIQAGDADGQARCLNMIGWFQVQLGNHDLAIVSCQQALTMLNQLGDSEGQANATHSLAYARQQLGQYQEAITGHTAAVALFRGLGDSYSEALVLNDLGDACLAAGLTERAGDAWRTGLRIFEQLHHRRAAAISQKVQDLQSRPLPPT